MTRLLVALLGLSLPLAAFSEIVYLECEEHFKSVEYSIPLDLENIGEKISGENVLEASMAGVLEATVLTEERASRYAINLMSGGLEWSRLRSRMQDGRVLAGTWSDWSVPEGKITVGPVTVTAIFYREPDLTGISSAGNERHHKVEISRNTLEIKRLGWALGKDWHFSFDCQDDKNGNKGASSDESQEIDCSSVDDLSKHGYEYETFKLDRETTSIGSCRLMDIERKF